MNQGFSNLVQHLKSNGLRLTSERRKLTQLVLSLRGHFNSDDVLRAVKDKKMAISRATVYRLLPVLVEARLIQQSLLTSEGQTRFEVTWNKAHHDHLICTGCKKVIEFQDDTVELIQREIANKYGFVLDRHVMELMGRCKECRGAPKHS